MAIMYGRNCDTHIHTHNGQLYKIHVYIEKWHVDCITANKLKSTILSRMHDINGPKMRLYILYVHHYTQKNT